MGVVVRRYIVDILTIIINFPYSTCISSFFCISILTSLFIFKMFFQSLIFRITRLLQIIVAKVSGVTPEVSNVFIRRARTVRKSNQL